MVYLPFFIIISQGGPSPRSCHKICFDPISKSIFVLGRYVESPTAPGQTLESDFYRYYVEFDQWVKINDHTAVSCLLLYDKMIELTFFLQLE